MPVMFLANSPVSLPSSATTWIAFAWLGVIVSFVAAVLWFRMIYDIGPSRASMMIDMFPLVGVLLGIMILGEKVSWQVVAGVFSFSRNIHGEFKVSLPSGENEDK